MCVGLQVYRNLETVTQESLDQVKRNFQWVADKLDYFIPKPQGQVQYWSLLYYKWLVFYMIHVLLI